MDVEKLKLEYFERVKLLADLRDVVIYKIQSEMKSNQYTPIKYFKIRLKDFESFRKNVDKEGIISVPEAFSSDIANDVLGIRLICLYKTELQELCDWVEKTFSTEKRKVYSWDGIGDMQPSHEELEKTLKTGYTSIHYIAKIKESERRGVTDLRELKFEIQNRTILEEAWGEFTHDVYKDITAPQYIAGSYRLLSKYLNILNEQVEFLKATYRDLSKDQITSGLIEDINSMNEERNFLDLSHFTVKNSRYTDCKYFTFNFIGTHLYDIEFNRCNLMNFDFTNAELKRVKFLNSKGVDRDLMNFDFKSSTLDTCKFVNSFMMNTDFGNVICRNSTFEDIEFMNTDFFNAEFAKCTLSNVRFMNTFNVEDLKLVDCTFDRVTAFGEGADKLMANINA